MHERPATLDDVPGLVELWRRFEQVSGQPETDEAAVRNDWDAPGFSLERSTRVLLDGDQVVGYAVLDDEGGSDSVVDPAAAGRGLEDHLLAFLEARSDERGLDLVHFWAGDDVDARERFVRRGWTARRAFWRMRRELDVPVAEPAWPPGVAVRGMGASRDGRAVHALVQEAFGDIGDHHVLASYDAWAAAMLTPLRFDPELYLLAEQDGRLVGVCLTEARDAVGFVRQIAVGRADRGRGVAAALLIEAFRRHAAHGFTATVLGVDTTNTTGALRLYESAGMRVIEQLTRWERAART